MLVKGFLVRRSIGFSATPDAQINQRVIMPVR